MECTKKQMSDEIKGRILALHEEGISNRQIGRRVGYSEGAVRYFLRNYNETKDIRRKSRGSKIPARDLRKLKILALANRFASAKELKIQLSGTYYGNKSVRTIQRTLKKMGLGAFRPAKKPLLTKKMQRDRLNWVEVYQNWTTEDWSRVIFSDESRFNLMGPDGNKRVRRRRGERYSDACVQSTTKHPPYVMVWGCITAYGLGSLHFVKGIMNAEKYKETLQNHALPTIEELTQYTDRPLFQDDSAPCHRAQSVNVFKESLGIESLPWPGNSPDLNPIENLWAIMGRKLRQFRLKNIEELKNKIKHIWECEISPEIIKNLYSSMPVRVREIKKARGGHIRY